MPRDDTGGKSPAASPAGSDEGWQLPGRGGKPKSSPSGGTPAALAPSPAGGGGLAQPPAADAPSGAPSPAGTPVAAKKPSPRRQEPSPVRATVTERVEGKIDEIMLALGKLTSTVVDMGERLDAVERGSDADDDDDLGDDEDSGDGSSVSSGAAISSDEDDDAQPFLVVQPNCGHWGARQLHHDVDQEPHRYSLHGYEPYDGLKEGRRGGGGTLGLGLRWLEPGCLYLKTGVDGLKKSIKGLDSLKDSLADPDDRRATRELRDDLVATLNTLKGAFGGGRGARRSRAGEVAAALSLVHQPHPSRLGA